MSDSIKKWKEMEEDRLIFESPDNGKTVTARPFGGGISERVIVSKKTVTDTDRKQAYAILLNYTEEAIMEAVRIINIGR